jgi:hypothetical protein
MSPLLTGRRPDADLARRGAASFVARPFRPTELASSVAVDPRRTAGRSPTNGQAPSQVSIPSDPCSEGVLVRA